MMLTIFVKMMLTIFVKISGLLKVFPKTNVLLIIFEAISGMLIILAKNKWFDESICENK